MTSRIIRSLQTIAPVAAFSFSCISATSSALAQEPVEEDAEEESLEDLEDLDDEEGSSLDDLAEEEESESEESEGSVPETPIEEKKKDGQVQLLIGLRYRALITPKFLINMFGVDGGRTVFVNGFGPEIGGYWGKRDNGFMLMFSPWIAYYSMKPTPFRTSGEANNLGWEIVESDMKVWYLTIDTMWDHRIADRFSFMVGGSFGLGIVGGDLRRQEAFYVGPGDGKVPDLALCDQPPLGSPGTAECPGDGNYDITGTTTSDPWPVYPWINFQAGLRYQPIDEFIARFDFGVGSSGFWLGLGADYSLFL